MVLRFLMTTLQLEICAETLQACVAAREGGADRIELCSDLVEGGVTPSHGLIRRAILESKLPVHVMLRPRAGNFVYSAAEFDVICSDLEHAAQLGAAGVVCGILREDNTVDEEKTAKLAKLAGPMEVTFHRAFDETPDLAQALEDVIACGCRRVLTLRRETNRGRRRTHARCSGRTSPGTHPYCRGRWHHGPHCGQIASPHACRSAHLSAPTIGRRCRPRAYDCSRRRAGFRVASIGRSGRGKAHRERRKSLNYFVGSSSAL